MKAVLVREPGSLEVTSVPDPTPAADELVIAVDSCGICGTDQHIVSGDNPNARYPVTPGHEFAGTVVAAGAAARRLAVGTRVAVDPSISCGVCAQCRAGRENLCPRKGGYGTARPGALADYVAVRERNCEPLPDATPLSWGAVAEPLACVLHGIDRLGPVVDQRVLLYGAGPIGLMTAQLLAHGGAREVAIVDRNPRRLPATVHFGASTSADQAEALAQPTEFDVVVDATGAPPAIEDGLRRLRRGGRFLLMGVARRADRISISPLDVNWGELTILGSMAINHTYARAVELLGTNVVAVDRLITDRVSLDQFGDALAALSGTDQLKIQVAP